MPQLWSSSTIYTHAQNISLNAIVNHKTRARIYTHTYAYAHAHEQTWGGDKQSITHVVFHSCTGFKAPGVELDLVDGLGLTNVQRRLGINYMGCFGAFSAISVARTYVDANPGSVVLIVCCEVCLSIVNIYILAHTQNRTHTGTYNS
jgi:predicted naringenin-chalcone synthase